MITTVSNEYKYRLLKATETDTHKIILMQTGFTFDKDAHSIYADVSASELTTANGYTTGGATLTGVVVTKDNANDKAILSANDVQWTASGGTIATSGAIIYNDTMPDDPIVQFLDAEGALSTPDGIVFQINDIALEIA